ncbi:MAG: hypothetical protein ACI9IP_002615 [Arcticibacterium sp.]|jgi:hypothetical protein
MSSLLMKKTLAYFLSALILFSIVSCQSVSSQELPWSKSDLLFEDSGTNNWQEKWLLDGQHSKVINTEMGMELIAGTEHGNDTCHTVLWTETSFKETSALNMIIPEQIQSRGVSIFSIFMLPEMASLNTPLIFNYGMISERCLA